MGFMRDIFTTSGTREPGRRVDYLRPELADPPPRPGRARKSAAPDEAAPGKQLVDHFGAVRVFTVDGEALRARSPEAHEFGTYGIHDDYPGVIPAGEVWIDQSYSPAERWYFMHTALSRLRHHLSWEAGERQERRLREAADGVDFDPDSAGPPPEGLYQGDYGQTGGVTIRLVNGRLVRDHFKTDFTEGGHHYVYPWIPEPEIWVESDVEEQEIPLVALHEFVERTLMKERRLSYNQAHTAAARVEFAREGRFDRESLVPLTEQTALAMADETAPAPPATAKAHAAGGDTVEVSDEKVSYDEAGQVTRVVRRKWREPKPPPEKPSA